MRTSPTRFLPLVCLATAACSAADPGHEDNPVPPLPDDAVAVLEIYPLDLWAQPLPPDARLEVDRDGVLVDVIGAPIGYVPLDEAGAYRIRLTASDHEPLEVSLSFDGSAELDATRLGAKPSGHGVSASHEIRDVEGEQGALPVHTLYLGLRHKWFSAEGRPARRGNLVDFYLDGEEAWGAVAEELRDADDTVLVASWWFESDFELVRGDAEITPADTIMGRLEASDAYKRVLIGQFVSQDGLLSGINADEPLHDHGAAAGDDFEFMGQANPSSGMLHFAIPGFEFGDRVRAAHPESADRGFEAETAIESTIAPRDVDLTDWPIDVEVNHASWHQKFVVADEVAFVGGMNYQKTDWDTSAHLVDDPRRRGEVPRKDFMVRIDGPSVQDVAEVFQQRWDLVRQEGADYSELASSFEVDRDLAEHADGIQLQVTATMPDPLWEHAIAESWLNAVAQAEDYILIEDQYFRAPMLTEAILARMAEVPGLRLVVITRPVSEWTDPGCSWTHRTDTQLEAALGDRYQLFQLRSFAIEETWGWDETEARYADIYIHSKLLIVDDTFLSVGSANKNNRGMIYEGEMNVAVVDRDWVRAARRRVLAAILPPGTPATDEVSAWWSQLIDAAAWNDAVRAAWEAEGDDISLDGAPLPAMYTPRGFLHDLDFRTVDDCLMEDVGPDMT
jgi:phosphatidylserine/phosphatidylglycerophosphate/cardiolipin synthase-like enzyme